MTAPGSLDPINKKSSSSSWLFLCQLSWELVLTSKCQGICCHVPDLFNTERTCTQVTGWEAQFATK
jgi:hypothetical protein